VVSLHVLFFDLFIPQNGGSFDKNLFRGTSFFFRWMGLKPPTGEEVGKLGG